MARIALLCLGVCLTAAWPASAQTREQKVQDDRKKVEAASIWLYNDLARGFAQAKASGKPLLVIFRCIPCAECVKLDDDLVNQDPRVRPLLDKFVCVRVVSTNGLDLALFQYDYDQSFAAFLLHADGTIYGRYGTRSHRTSWADDVSIEGLARALEGALDLHRAYPRNRAELAGKRGPKPTIAAPEQFPALRGKYGPTVNFEGKAVLQTCIHCHQIGDAQRQLHRGNKEPIPEQLLFSYPHPKALGFVLDPKERATVLRVAADSPAAQAGFRAGDVIVRLHGQPLLSLADIQWVLHQTPAAGATLLAQVRRGGETLEVMLKLAPGWRQADDISWRATTWGLRRMATGGMVLESVSADERQEAKLPAAGMALRVKHVGQYGAHAAAKNAGIRPGDIVIGYDGRTDLPRETDVLAHSLSRRKPGDRVVVNLLRAGQKLDVTLPMQD